ncbi:unnamed protein product [Meloidogyne enterolobii]|uniref:Uncharacterized protein n=1 Tax=Meloidogyne enterolobii TaxID=390850 RepID=A0ACB0Z4D6_MELEN
MLKLRPISVVFSVKNFASYLRGPVIGINFGYTNSSVAILEVRNEGYAWKDQGRKAKVLKNDEDAFTTPSVVAFKEDGECLVGAPAVRQAFLNSQNTVFGIKRLIGRKFDDKKVQDFRKTVPYKIVKSSNGDACVEVQSQIYSLSQIASKILTKLKQTAENNLNKNVKNAMITVPGYFDNSQRLALREAARLANLKIIRFVIDSRAAAIACGFDIARDRMFVLIFWGILNFRGPLF